jgi:hypothetical protein
LKSRCGKLLGGHCSRLSDISKLGITCRLLTAPIYSWDPGCIAVRVKAVEATTTAGTENIHNTSAPAFATAAAASSVSADPDTTTATSGYPAYSVTASNAVAADSCAAADVKADGRADSCAAADFFDRVVDSDDYNSYSGAFTAVASANVGITDPATPGSVAKDPDTAAAGDFATGTGVHRFVEKRGDLAEFGKRADAHASYQSGSGGDPLAESAFNCGEKPVLQNTCANVLSCHASSRVEDINKGGLGFGMLASLLLISVLVSLALLLVLLFNATKDNEDTTPSSATTATPSTSALARDTGYSCTMIFFDTIYSFVLRNCNPKSRSAGYRGGELPRGYTMRQLISRRKYGKTVFAIACCVLSSVTATAVLSSVTAAPVDGWVMVPDSKSCYVDENNCVVFVVGVGGGVVNCTFAYSGLATLDLTQPEWEVRRETPPPCDREYLQVGQRKYCRSASDGSSEPFPVALRVSGTTDFTFVAQSKKDRLFRLRLCVHDLAATERRMSASDSLQCMVGGSSTVCKK